MDELRNQLVADFKQLSIFDKKDVMARIFLTGAVTVASTNILAAKIQSAKTDYERNESIKEADKLVKEMVEIITGG